MHSRNSLAPILMAGSLAVGALGIAPAANAASAGLSFLNSARNAESSVVQVKKRGSSARLYVPIAPSYRYYDYPYYYSRGHYPTHIQPGFIYYGYPYSYYKNRFYRKYGVRVRKY
jgi:hypothetical protein